MRVRGDSGAAGAVLVVASVSAIDLAIVDVSEVVIGEGNPLIF